MPPGRIRNGFRTHTATKQVHDTRVHAFTSFSKYGDLYCIARSARRVGWRYDVEMSVGQQRRVARALCAGGPEVIEIGVEELSPLKPGEVLVHVEAAGLNHAETLIRSGKYTVRLPFPHAVGGEGAGTVAATGPEVDIRVDARVCWGAVLGSCATFVKTQASLLAPLPDGLSFEDGASLAVAGLTAGGLTRVWPLRGKPAVVWGAAGAVGRMLVAMLAESGADVIGVASGRRVEAVRASRRRHVVATGDGGRVRAVTDGRGAAAVFDPIGAETYETGANARTTVPRINYGELSGPVPHIDLHRLFAGSLFVTKYNGMRWVDGFHEFAS